MSRYGAFAANIKIVDSRYNVHQAQLCENYSNKNDFFRKDIKTYTAHPGYLLLCRFVAENDIHFTSGLIKRLMPAHTSVVCNDGERVTLYPPCHEEGHCEETIMPISSTMA